MHRGNHVTLVVLLLGLLAHAVTAQSTYTVDYSGSTMVGTPTLRRIDVSTGASLQAVPLVGASQHGLTGLAIHPTTGTIYATNGAANPVRTLVTIDPATGVLTTIGSLGVPISDLSFDGGGTLYGIEGNRAGGTGNLHVIDILNATTSVVASHGGTTAGGIAVNPIDGLIYRIYLDSGTNTLVSIDPGAGFAATFIANVASFDEANSLGFDASGAGDLLSTRWGDSDIWRISPLTGAAVPAGTTDHEISDFAQSGLPFGGPPNFPGTGEDLVTEAAVNGDPLEPAISGATDTLTLAVGDNVTVRHLSPAGTFIFLELVVFGTIAPLGTAAIEIVPGLHLLTGGAIYEPVSGGVAGVPLTLPTIGVAYSGVHVGGALSGVSTLIQAISLTATAANSTFASTHGVLIEFL